MRVCVHVSVCVRAYVHASACRKIFIFRVQSFVIAFVCVMLSTCEVVFQFNVFLFIFL